MNSLGGSAHAVTLTVHLRCRGRRRRCTHRTCPRPRATTWPRSAAAASGTGETNPYAIVSTRGLVPGPIEAVHEGTQLSARRDPDGSTITFHWQLQRRRSGRPALWTWSEAQAPRMGPG